MLETLLQTKLSVPPLRPDLLSRPRLLARLDQALRPDCRLTFISGPAGYGKTTLVSHWAQQTDQPVAWLSLDEGDNDPVRFLAYVIAALQTIRPTAGQQAGAHLQSPQPPPPEIILTTLINDIASTGKTTVLILDDYHLIQTPAIHKQVAFLLGRLPKHMHLFLLTREDPFLPLARLRARGQLLEIHQRDLRFTLEEITILLHEIMALDLTAADIAALERRTEGWIAGLHLAALSMRGRRDLAGFVQAFTGSSRFILDYLLEEVFEQQSSAVREFLLKTSILARLSAPLCNAVTGNTDSQMLLESLEQTHLFIIPLDQSRRWYRYHHLFAELLQHRLRIDQPELESELHLRASRWFAHQNLAAEAIHHALAAGAGEQAVDLISQSADAFLKRGQLITLVGWFEQLPEDLIRSKPDPGLSYVWALLLLGRFDEAENWLAHFEALAQAAPSLLGHVAAAQAYAARSRGDSERAIQKSKQALKLLPPGDITARSTLTVNLGLVYWHEGQLQQAVPPLEEAYELGERVGNQYGSLTAQIFLARTLAAQGALRQAENALQKILAGGGENPILVLAHYDLAGLYLEWDDLARARAHLDQGLTGSTRSGNVEFQNAGHMLKAYILAAQGNMLEAAAEAEISRRLSTDLNPATQARTLACSAHVALAMGDTPAAENYVQRMPQDVDANSFYRFLGLIKARLLLAQGEKAAAREMLAVHEAQAAKAGWGYATVAIRALQIIAAETEQAALSHLARALSHSKPEGFIRTYVDAGRDLIPILRESARRGMEPEYCGRILDAYGDTKPAFPLIEPLTPRELEVLRLVVAGMSNREIAGVLVISTGTAKTHVHNICIKMGVHNRIAAATRAKELGLV